MRSLRKLTVSAALFLLVAAANVAAAAEPVTIYMIAETEETHYAAQQAMIDLFHERHDHIRIELVHLTGQVVASMLNLIAGNVPVDIGYMDPWVAVEWGRMGILEDLAPYIARDPDYFSDIPPSLFDLSTVEGKVYGIPMDTQAGAIFYNIDAYNEAGLAFPSADWTYDDLLENARRLTIQNSDGSVLRHGFRIPTSRNWVPAVWAFGGDVLDSWTNPTRFVGNGDPLRQALEYYNNLLNSGVVQDRAIHDSAGAGAQFSQRRVAMIQTNTFALTSIYGTAEFPWDVAPLPKGPAGRTGFINAHQRFMFSNSQHKEEAWEVMRFFASPEARTVRARISGSMPVHLEVIRSEWLPLPAGPSKHLLLEDLPTAKSPWPLHGDIWSAIDPPALDVIWGRQPTATAIANMEQLTTAAIRTYRQHHGLE